MKRLEQELAKHVDDASEIPFRRAVFRSGAEPRANACHENVKLFVAENPGHRRICEWLITSRIVCDKHSIVGSPNGDKFDITPLKTKAPFLLHFASEEDFEAEPRNQIIISSVRETSAVAGLATTKEMRARTER